MKACCRQYSKELSGPELPIGRVVRSERWHAAAMKAAAAVGQLEVLDIPVGMPLPVIMSLDH
jgi:hypothetical protein